jgi:hypothetical protein
MLSFTGACQPFRSFRSLWSFRPLWVVVPVSVVVPVNVVVPVVVVVPVIPLRSSGYPPVFLISPAILGQKHHLIHCKYIHLREKNYVAHKSDLLDRIKRNHSGDIFVIPLRMSPIYSVLSNVCIGTQRNDNES